MPMIAFATGPAQMRESSQRLAGYKEAMADAQVPIDPRWIIEGNHMFESGLACGKQLLDIRPV